MLRNTVTGGRPVPPVLRPPSSPLSLARPSQELSVLLMFSTTIRQLICPRGLVTALISTERNSSVSCQGFANRRNMTVVL